MTCICRGGSGWCLGQDPTPTIRLWCLRSLLLEYRHRRCFFYTLEDERLEHVLMEVWKIIFLSKWVICRFQPLIFQGVDWTIFVVRHFPVGQLAKMYFSSIENINWLSRWFTLTPLKFNMDPANQPLEKGGFPLETIIFSFHVKLLGVHVMIERHSCYMLLKKHAPGLDRHKIVVYT